MALSHLLRPESNLSIRRNGFSKTMRWLSRRASDTESETEKTSHLKKTVGAKERRAEAVESVVKKYMESNPGSFPKPTTVRNEVGGSFYIVKEILGSLKHKMLGTQKPENNQNPTFPTPEVNPLASGLEPSSQPDKRMLPDADVHNYDREDPGYASSNAAEESSSNMVIDKDTSTKASPNLKSKTLEEVDQVNAVSPTLPLSLEMNDAQRKEAVSTKQGNSDLKMLLESIKLLPCKDADQSHDASGNQLEREVRNGLGFCSEICNRSDLAGSSKSFGGLAEMFRHKTYDGTAAKRENQESQSNIVHSDVLGSTKDEVSPVNKLTAVYMSSPSESPRKLHGMFWPNRLDLPGTGSLASKDEATIQSESIPNVAGSFTGNDNIAQGDMRTENDQALGGNTNLKRLDHSLVSALSRMEESKEKEDSQIKDLVSCIRHIFPPPSVSGSQNNVPTSELDRSSRENYVQGTKPLSNSKKERKTSSSSKFVRTDSMVNGASYISPGNFKTQDDKTTSPEHVVSSWIKKQTSAQMLLSHKDSDDIQSKFLRTKESDENKVVVKFLLRRPTENDVRDTFQKFGDISRVELPYVEGAHFQLVNVYFRTSEGLRNALQKSDIVLGHASVTAEAAGSCSGISNKMFVPSLIVDPNFPAALGKNPTRTVMIKPLTHDISSCHVESALSFCGGKVTGFFLGSSNSVAYVELETEEAKEKALARQSVDVLGKKVAISRIDIPRTTVARIFHPSPGAGDLLKLCYSLGKVKFVKKRRIDVIDVHYRLAEWPNMAKILNSLNGAYVDGCAVRAQPATVFPPDILGVLWSQPDGRKHVLSVMQNLMQKLEESVVEMSEIPVLMKNFYGPDI